MKKLLTATILNYKTEAWGRKQMRKEVVEFKSIPELYEKEKFGTKPNTVRKLPIGGERERKLRMWASLVDYGQIAITNSETGESFLRNVADVTIFEGLCIISWEHPRS